MHIELDFSDQINAKKIEELGFEEEISDEVWAAEEGKGKTLNKPFRTPKGPKKVFRLREKQKG